MKYLKSVNGKEKTADYINLLNQNAQIISNGSKNKTTECPLSKKQSTFY